MTDYSKSKIYKIVDNTNDDIYIGSTVEATLAKRLTKHRSDYKSYLKGTHNYVTSFKILKNNDYSIILIEPYPCKSRDELKARERFYIEGNICVNRNVPGRTQQEYRVDNNEQIKKLQKQFYVKNIGQINKKITCPCGGKYTQQHKTRHFKSKLHLNWLQNEQNKIDIKTTEKDIL